jgi:hypothetical protein
LDMQFKRWNELEFKTSIYSQLSTIMIFIYFFFFPCWHGLGSKTCFTQNKNIKMWLHERGPCNVIWSYRQTFVKYVHGMEWQMKLGHADATHIYKTTSCLCHTMGSHLGHFFMHSSIVFLQFLQPCWGVVLH